MTATYDKLSRLLAIPAVLIGLAGCGFQPLYGERRPAAVSPSELSSVQVDLIADREGQMLRNELLDLFQPAGASSKARYGLAVGLSIQRAGLGIRIDETATRANLIMVADFTVRDLANGDVMFRGRSRSITGYNVLDSEFATLSGENDAIRRAILDISQQISTRVSLVIADKGAGSTPPS